MGADFETAFPVLFDEAIRRFETSGRVLVRPPARPVLYGHKEILSLDESCFTQAGRISPDATPESERQQDPYARIFFMKCGARPRIAAWRFLRLLGDILGVEIVTEYHEPLSEPCLYGYGDGWSVQYTLDMTDEEIALADREMEIEELALERAAQ